MPATVSKDGCIVERADTGFLKSETVHSFIIKQEETGGETPVEEDTNVFHQQNVMCACEKVIESEAVSSLIIKEETGFDMWY